MNLYVSMINNLTVMQGNNSTLTSENKQDTRTDIGKGKNKSIDLGEGSKKLTSSFLSQDGVLTEKLFKILSKDRKCTVTDKFLGIIKCSVIDYRISNSDKFIGLTRFNVTFQINEDFNPKINYRGKILNDIHRLKEELSPIYLIVDNNTNSKESVVTNNIEFTDKITQDDYISKFRSTLRYVNNINRDVKLATMTMNDKMILRDGFKELENLKILNNSIFKINDYLSGYPAKELLDMGNAGAIVTNINNSSMLFNKILLIINLKKLLINDISMQDNIIANIERLIDNTIAGRINAIIVDDNAIDLNAVIGNVLNFRDNNNEQIEEVELFNEILSRHVFEKYGNLNYMEDILMLNGLQEDTIIRGRIKMFKVLDD